MCSILLNDFGGKSTFYRLGIVVEALGKIKDNEATSTLASYLLRIEGDKHQSDLVAKAINSIGRDEAVKILVARLSLDDSYNIAKAVNALSKLKAKEVNPSLIPLLEHESEDVRRSVVKAFSQTGDESVVKPLCNRFYKEKPYIQNEIIDALGYVKSKESVLPLIQFINHDEEYVRGNVAWVLGNIGDKRATKTLCNRLRFDDSPQVRSRAAEALGKIGDPASLETLQEIKKILYEYQGDKFLKEEVQKAISKIKSPG